MKGKTVVVSGASQGLGRQLADDLHSMGANVILLARSIEKLESIAESHNSKANYDDQWTKIYGIDLADKKAYPAFKEWIQTEGIIPDIVFCCAGSSIPKLFNDLSINELDSGIDINYKTCVFLIHTLAPLMKSTNGPRRHIVIISSAVAFYQFIGYSQYSPMKMALRGLGDSLSHELNPFNIDVHTVFPGNFDSEGYKEENLTKPSITSEIEGGSYPISVEKCSQIVLDSLSFNKSYWRNVFWPNGQRYVFTDLLSWVMFTFTMGFSPRDFYGLEIIVGFIGLVFARVIDKFHEYLIRKWFKSNDKEL